MEEHGEAESGRSRQVKTCKNPTQSSMMKRNICREERKILNPLTTIAYWPSDQLTTWLTGQFLQQLMINLGPELINKKKT